MAFWSIIPSVVTGVADIFKLKEQGKLSAQEAEDKLKQYILESQRREKDRDHELEMAGATNISKEITGKSALQRNWRPAMMSAFGLCVVVSIMAKLFFGIELDYPPELWQILMIGIGGYIGGRTVEKSLVAKHEKENKK